MSDWKPWNGKRQFKGDRMLQVRFRNGIESRDILPAEKWRGKWGHPFPDNADFDIVAVRDMTPKDPNDK